MSKLRAIAVATIALLTCAAILAPGSADAKKRRRNRTTVTIVANGGDFSGSVKHRKPECVADREVIVFEQEGSAPSPAADTQIASDTTDELGRWDTGNTGANDGDYYAHAPATLGCKAGTSKTVTVTGRPEEPE